MVRPGPSNIHLYLPCTSLPDAVVSNTSLIAGVKKMTAKAAKTVKYGSNVDGISTAEPEQYAKRFIAFMGDAIE